MNFIQIAYSVSVPFILLMCFFGSKENRKFYINLLTISNILLIGYSIFLIRQLIGLYQLSKYLNIDTSTISRQIGANSIGVMLLMFLPFFSLISFLQKSRYFSLLLLFLLFWINPFFTWSSAEIFFNVLTYFCLFITGYSFLWLLNKLPNQSLEE